jgi:futalosine hydrolase
VTVLIVVAVEAERDAVVRDVPDDAGVRVVISGVGPVAAATTTATALATHDHDCVVSAGICGGFRGRAGVGDVIVASESVAADLGCRTEEGFLSLHDLGLAQESRLVLDTKKWPDRLHAAGIATVQGELLTLSCMTGSDAEADVLATRHPDAVGEAMEGWGVAWAARQFAVPCGEVRVVSNFIGRRDPSTWDLSAAFDVLSRAFAVLLAEPLP